MIIENRKSLVQAVKLYKEEYVGILETSEGEAHIVKHGKFLIIGGACNVGLIIDDGVLYDDDYSMDQNLEWLIEELDIQMYQE